MKLFFTIEITPQEVIEILEYQDKKQKKSSDDFSDHMKKYEAKNPIPPIVNPVHVKPE